MAAIPDEAKHLFENKEMAHVATLNADGSPQVSAVWIARDGDLITFNTAEGRVKPKNLRRDGRVAISITGEENPYENLIVQGKVVELTDDGADADIDALAKRYLGVDSYPYRQPGEERVIVKIEPQKVNHTNP
ncbi:MAG TPA: PPOX class F420-dependent oxidoreductase [Solirubrobacterales bacterium]|jgi:PPOX class probable F420-dependent enzyme|nr:PPOX class F420-dependent oxidoreductase [Solirubrobacterales bacterium]